MMVEGDKVRCVEASIDRHIGKGMTGTISGFARLSAYHPREAMIRFEDGQADWFWLRGLVAA